MNMFTVDKMNEVLKKPYTKNGDENLRILFGEKFEYSDNINRLNNILIQLQYNLTSPTYDGLDKNEVISNNINQLKKENLYLDQCSLESALSILQTLDLYKSK